MAEQITSLKQFLESYFDWLHFSKWTPEQRQKLIDLQQQGRVGPPMSHWKVADGMPVANDLVMRELYNYARRLIIGMRDKHNNVSRLTTYPLIQLIDDKFYESPTPPITDNEFEQISLALQDQDNFDLYHNSATAASIGGYDTEFITAINNKDLSPHTLQKLSAILGEMNSNGRYNGVQGLKIPDIRLRIRNYDNDLAGLTSDPTKLTGFNGKYKEFLEKIYIATPNDASKGGNELQAIEQELTGRNLLYSYAVNAKSKNPDSLGKEIEDENNLFEKAKLKVQDLKNRVSQIWNHHFGHIYEESDAFEIMNQAIMFHGFKISDGMDKFLEILKDKITTPPSASSSAKNVASAISGIKSLAGNMVGGALNNPRKMNALVQELIKHFTLSNAPNAEKDCKVVLELLSVLRAGIFDQKYNEFRKDYKWDLFSDLPAFGPAPLKFFAKAADYSLNIGALGIYSIGAGGKSLLLNRPKKLEARAKDNKRLAETADEVQGTDKHDRMMHLIDFWNNLVGGEDISFRKMAGMPGIRESLTPRSNKNPFSSTAKKQGKYDTARFKLMNYKGKNTPENYAAYLKAVHDKENS